MHRRWTRLMAAACLILLTTISRADAKGLNIYWVDVEGGAATLIVTPTGESVLIDTGNPGHRDPGRIAEVATRVAGIKQIDHLIITHYHGDHYGGAAMLSKLLPIKTLYDNGKFEGQSKEPYSDWAWKRLNQSVASPYVLRLPDGRTVLAGRFYAPTRHTGLSWLDFEKGTVSSFIALPSGGDTGYPGLALIGKYLWVSYYSSHEGKTSIYLAKVQMYD